MEPKVIKTETDYEAALAHVAELMDAQPGSPEEEELELFSRRALRTGPLRYCTSRSGGGDPVS